MRGQIGGVSHDGALGQRTLNTAMKFSTSVSNSLDLLPRITLGSEPRRKRLAPYRFQAVDLFASEWKRQISTCVWLELTPHCGTLRRGELQLLPPPVNVDLGDHVLVSGGVVLNLGLIDLLGFINQLGLCFSH